jgi:hypothetical protein
MSDLVIHLMNCSPEIAVLGSNCRRSRDTLSTAWNLYDRLRQQLTWSLDLRRQRPCYYVASAVPEIARYPMSEHSNDTPRCQLVARALFKNWQQMRSLNDRDAFNFHPKAQAKSCTTDGASRRVLRKVLSENTVENLKLEHIGEKDVHLDHTLE